MDLVQGLAAHNCMAADMKRFCLILRFPGKWKVFLFGFFVQKKPQKGYTTLKKAFPRRDFSKPPHG